MHGPKWAHATRLHVWGTLGEESKTTACKISELTGSGLQGAANHLPVQSTLSVILLFSSM
jgi:hypothetical protein